MQAFIEYPDDLRNIAVPFAEIRHRTPDLIAVVAGSLLVAHHSWMQLAGQNYGPYYAALILHTVCKSLPAHEHV